MIRLSVIVIGSGFPLMLIDAPPCKGIVHRDINSVRRGGPCGETQRGDYQALRNSPPAKRSAISPLPGAHFQPVPESERDEPIHRHRPAGTVWNAVQLPQIRAVAIRSL